MHVDGRADIFTRQNLGHFVLTVACKTTSSGFLLVILMTEFPFSSISTKCLNICACKQSVCFVLWLGFCRHHAIFIYFCQSKVL